MISPIQLLKTLVKPCFRFFFFVILWQRELTSLQRPMNPNGREIVAIFAMKIRENTAEGHGSVL